VSDRSLQQTLLTQATLTATQRSLLSEYRTSKAQVRYILEKYPRARGNDFYLTLMWLRVFGQLKLPWIDPSVLERFNGKLETLRRSRQIIQNKDGCCLPDKEVRSHRVKKEETVSAIISGV
jgi:hypothetical protein